jgi:GH24 family phage-related lysozyme (muramidase)
MITSKQGIELIKKFEGCRLTSYRLPSEAKYTIGYGHYGVEKGATITELEAEKYLLRILYVLRIRSTSTTAFTILIKINLTL